MKRSCLAAILAAVHAGAVLAAPPDFKTSFDLRLRYEGLDTPARSSALDRTYGFSLARARFGADAVWPRWKLHGLVQAAGVAGLPHDGAFAAGPNYMAANAGDDDPSEIGLAELSAAYAHGGFKAILGRQPYADGNEVPTGVAYLDGIKKRLLSDRLIGVFEWPNVGRRFDGASLAYGQGGADLSGFALRPLTGAFDHQDAFKEIGDVSAFGLTLTGKYGAWIPRSELRIFAIQYRDDRRVARQLARGDLRIDTAGASLLCGNAAGHVLLWGALQSGEWGASDQQAWAYIASAGRSFPHAAGKPIVYLGLEQSSGDDGPGGDHGTFFNLLPTNHKYYGVMDYVDFPNLRDAYLESVLSVKEKLKVRAAVHDFALTKRTDAWYGGSGAFQETTLGYTARLPTGGYPSHDLGREADLELTWSGPKGLQLGVGGGRFWGGRAAEAFLPVEADGSWTYVEVVWKK